VRPRDLAQLNRDLPCFERIVTLLHITDNLNSMYFTVRDTNKQTGKCLSNVIGIRNFILLRSRGTWCMVRVCRDRICSDNKSR